jgi:TolB-like protein
MAARVSRRSVIVDGERMARARREAGLTQEALADLATGPHCLGLSSIKRAERGQAVDLSTAATLALLLKVPLRELVQQAIDPGLLPKPTLTLSRFRCLGADREQAHTAEGLSVELKVRCHRLWFPVVSAEAPLHVEELAPGVAEHDLGTHYLVAGTFAEHDGELRVSIEVTDLGSKQLRWANSYVRARSKLFELQRELASSITTELNEALVNLEAAKLEGYEPKDLNAWQQGIAGAWHFYRRSPQDNATARRLLGDALKRERSMPLAWYCLALTHQQDLVNQWTESPRSSIGALSEVCHEFERHYRTEPWSQIANAYLDIYLGERERAEDRLVSAIDSDPNISHAYALYGQTLAMRQEPEAALEQFDTALRLGPRDADRWTIHTGIALTHFAGEDYAAAVDAATRASLVRPDAAFPYGTAAAAHALMGNDERAQQLIDRMRRFAPRSTLAGLEAIVASTNKDIAQRYLEGLKRAGLKN